MVDHNADGIVFSKSGLYEYFGLIISFHLVVSNDSFPCMSNEIGPTLKENMCSCNRSFAP